MKNRLFIEEFDALSAEIRQNLWSDGQYDHLKWKDNKALLEKIKAFEIENVTHHLEKIWMMMNDIKRRPTCKHCGKDVRFKNSKIGFRQFCSTKCVANSSEVKAKTKNTQLEKYPEGHHMRNKEVVSRMVADMHERGSYQKGKETFKKHYGVENNYQREEVKAKIKETSIKKFGCENPMQNKEIKEKTAITVN